MDSTDFAPKPPSRIVELHPSRTPTHAFIPDPLPPGDWSWPTELWPLLTEARIALAKLDGVGRHLPNPTLLIRPLQQREAHASSSLEGTVTEPRRQALFQLENADARSTSNADSSFREVANYSRALAARRSELSDLPVSLRLIRELHAILMAGVRGKEQTPGQFRSIQVQIGSPPRFVPPPPEELAACLDAFERVLHSQWELDPLVRAFLAHYQFEAIHPFRDGNGRVGRLLLSLSIAETCGLSAQWLHMSTYFDQHKDDYVDKMLRISTHGEWTEWAEFCLIGAREQADDTTRRCDALLGLLAEFRKRVQGTKGTVRLSRLLESLFEVPATTIPIVERSLGISYNTARADIEKLLKVGVLKEISDLYPRTYYCPELIRITHTGDLGSERTASASELDANDLC